MSYSVQVVLSAFVLGLAMGALLHALLRRHRIQAITAEFETELQQRLLEEREPKAPWRSGPLSRTDRGYDA